MLPHLIGMNLEDIKLNVVSQTQKMIMASSYLATHKAQSSVFVVVWRQDFSVQLRKERVYFSLQFHITVYS